MAASRLLITAFAGFIVLGMPKSAFGVAWPSIAGDLDRNIAELGVALTIYIGGYFIASVLNGEAIRRLGLGRTLVFSGVIGTAAIAGYGVAGAWWVLLAAAFVLGISGGLIDAGLNAYVALAHTTRVMGFLHASFGVGSTLGPLLITVLLGLDISWRWGYGLLALLQAAITVSFWRRRNRWTVTEPEDAAAAPGGRLRPGMITGLAAFFLYTAIEVGAGQWLFSLLSEGRGYTAAAAGLVVTGYWATLTAGRVALGIVGDRLSHASMLRLALVGTVAGLTAVWWDPAPGIGAAGSLLLGFSLSPIFPLLTQDTPRRMGAGYAPRAIGYQLAAATVGAAVIPGGIGLLVAQVGLEIVAPVLLISSAALAAVMGKGRLMSTGDRTPVTTGGPVES